MCRRNRKFSSAPDPHCPFETPSTYLLTDEAKEILAQHQSSNGTPLFHPSPLPHLLDPTLSSQELHFLSKRQRRAQARHRGHRLLTVCGRWRGKSRVPDLRLTGKWLEAAGFGLGQEVEVEVEMGRLVVRAV